MMKSKTARPLEPTAFRRDSRDAKRHKKERPNRPVDLPSITEGVKKVFDCYGEVLRKLANE